MRTRSLILPLLPFSLLTTQALAQEPPPASPVAPDTAPQRDLLNVSPTGLTSEQVAKRAAQTSYTAKANEAALRAAAARVDVAWSSFLPRLSAVARYTRLSDFTPPSLGTGNLVGTLAPSGTINPTPTVSAGGLSFPLVLDNWLLQATLNVPISDYFLRINQNYSAATLSVTAARYDVATARAKSASDGKVTYYSWLQARGAVVVALETLDDQKSHLKDAGNQFQAGNVSKADVLRAETAVAAAELQVVRSKNFADLNEQQLRIAMHSADTETFAPGESLDAPVPPLAGDLKALWSEAHSARNEIKSIDANAEVLRKQATSSRNGVYPVLSAVADGIYANPNQRRFPATNEWFPTWDVGVQLTWSPNDVLGATANGRALEAQAAQLEAQKQTIRDGIDLEVTQAYQSATEADQATESAKKELASATEAYRVASQLFAAGRGTSLILTDAETDLTRARLDELNAKVQLRLARVRLEHALGRDTKDAAIAP